MFVQEKTQGEVTKAPAKVLKLSEAIRIGAALRPHQCVGVFFGQGGSCALGAAYEAITGRTLKEGSTEGAILKGIVPGYDDYGLRFEITGRNDRGETREHIADWLESRGL